MKARNFVGGLIAVLAVGFVLTAPAHAQIDNIMTFGGWQFSPNADFTFTRTPGGNGGTLVTLPGGTQVLAGGPLDTSYNGFAYLNFGPLSEVAGSASVSGNNITATFNGGNFSVTTAPGGGGSTLLTGTFGPSQFNATVSNGATMQTLQFGNVIYSGGSYMDDFLSMHPGRAVIGSFSFGLTSISSPYLSVTNGGLDSFKANGSGGTFDALAVPEPGEYAAMGLIGLTVCGLILRARVHAKAAA
jgi:hypothetical protein